MLPIFTTEQVRDGIDTGDLLIDLSDYIMKKDAATKTDLEALTTVIAGKLDATPQHKHDISNVKDLQEELDSKYDTSKRYPHNVILSDAEKISYLEAPKIELLELVKNKEAEGYKFYVDESNGDLMITLDNVLIGSYSIASGKWSWESNGNYADVNHNHDERYSGVSHTHTKIDNSLNVTGWLTAGGSFDVKGATRLFGYTTAHSTLKTDKNLIVTEGASIGGGLTVNSADGTLAKFFNSQMSKETGGIPSGAIYWGKSTANDEGAFMDYSITSNQVNMGIRGRGTRLWFNNSQTQINGNLIVPDSLTATPSQTKISSQETLINSSITKTGGQLDVGGTINSVVNGHKLGILTIDKPFMRYWNENLTTTDNKLYFQMGKNNTEAGGCFWMEYTYPGQMLFRFHSGNSFIRFYNTDHLMKLHANVQAEKNLEVGGTLSIGTTDVGAVLENHYDALNAVCNATLINITDINTCAASIATMQTKITQMEAILQNHYQALLELCQKHGMIDANTNDGANITPVMEE